MNDDLFKNLGKINLDLKMPELKLNPPNTDSMQKQIETINKFHDEQAAKVAKEKQQEEEYRQNVLTTLMSIEKNTGDINQLVLLMRQNTDKQDEILDVMKAILEITKADNEEEVNSLYRKAMNKANELNDDVETATALIGYGKIVWQAVKTQMGLD